MPVPYHLSQFPPRNIDWQALLPLIGPANAAVARYEGLLLAIPNADVLLAPLTSQEAVLSSRIEGTQATLGEVLEFEAEGHLDDESTAKKADIREVLNYRAALREAVRLLQSLPLSQRLVKQAHAVLMDGVRGRNKEPGEYRRVQNWIGAAGAGVETARFIPIEAHRIDEAMSAWEAFLHTPADDVLVQLAIAHAEFEAIHPFLDGNGRLGRLLVPLFLLDKKLLSSPSFYISAYLESRRDEYYDRLLAVSHAGDWTGWCMFFLRAITEQARENTRKAQAILDLYRDRKEWIGKAAKSQYGVRVVDWLFERPILKIRALVDTSGVPKASVQRIIRILHQENVLIELRSARGRRPAVFAFRDLLNIAEGHDVF